MALILSDSENYKSIANAIRTKLSTNRVYKPSEMDEAVMKMGLHGSMSTDPTLKDVFNHGSISGFNPIFASDVYDPDIRRYPGIDTQYPTAPDRQATTYFKVLNGNIIKSVSQTNRGEFDARTVITGFYAFNKQYTKICFDCEVVDGVEDRYNYTMIFSMKGGSQRSDYWNYKYLTRGGASPVTYNMERQIVKLPILGAYDDQNQCARYYIGFSNVKNTFNIYSIWLEP